MLYTTGTGQISRDTSHAPDLSYVPNAVVTPLPAGVQVSPDEFRYIIRVFARYRYLQSHDSLCQVETGVLNRIIGDKDAIIAQQDTAVTTLQQAIEEQKPGWFDRFLTGFTVGVGITVATVLITH